MRNDRADADQVRGFNRRRWFGQKPVAEPTVDAIRAAKCVSGTLTAWALLMPEPDES